MSTKIKKQEIIYISYDGIMESIGQSQVLPYLEGIAKFYKINLISFEKYNDLKNSEKVKKFNFRLKKFGISWSMKKYYNFPVIISTIFNILIGSITTLFLLIFHKIRIIHIRSYIPGLMVILLKYFFDFKLIFDMRGFLPEEKVDRMGWNKNGLIYLFFKKLEKKLINDSDSIICLTLQSVNILKKTYPSVSSNNFVVIPTCVNVNKFKILKNKVARIKNRIVFGHLGTIDKAYDIEKVIKFFSMLLKFNSKLIFKIFFKDSDRILDKIFKRYKVLKKNYSIQYFEHDIIFKEINKVDLGIFFLKENYSIKASFPTRIAEFFSCGKPILCNNFNKDISNIIRFNQVGLIIDFNDSNIKKTYMNIKKLLFNNNINNRCRKLAENKLSLKIGIKSYLKLYKKLLIR